MHHYSYNLHEIESMIPWEKEIYISLLAAYIKEENLKLKTSILE